MNIRPYAKAVIGAIIAAASAAIPMVDDGLTASEILGIIVAFLTGLIGVYSVKNESLNESDGDFPRAESGIDRSAVEFDTAGKIESGI